MNQVLQGGHVLNFTIAYNHVWKNYYVKKISKAKNMTISIHEYEKIIYRSKSNIVP